MAAAIKASHIAVFTFAIIAIAAIGFYVGAYKPRFILLDETCEPLPANIKFIGHAMTVSQVEVQSLAELEAAPVSLPRVPFGHLNSEWTAIKGLMRPSDTVHEFRTEISGGHLVLRQKCLVGQLSTWIR